jgi:EAL domain-containing protein (putative c-di-GMP-specific phosphodiesterase class I)
LTRLQAETEIRQAIDRREFLVYYQPVVSLQTGRIVSLEALARWRHPIRGLIAPNKFIPIAEETGLIFPISEIIFEKAFMQLRSWLDAGFEDLSMSVNVSARHLQDKSLPSLISGYLSQAGLSGHNISLEITESAMMLDLEQSLLVLGELRELGVQISIDDFGTGYSSLAYLKRLAANSIKIDKAFIKDVVENSDDATIVSAIVAMGHVLSMDVVAEGVENREQIRFLKRQFCEKAQGFFFSRPVPPEYITEVLISGYIYPIEDTNVA